MADDQKPAAKPEQVPQGVFDLYDQYAHGDISRRVFFDKLAAYAVGGLTVSSLAACVMPNYGEEKQQVVEGDVRLVEERITYASPNGAGEMGALLVKPAGLTTKRGGVVVVHENRGLNPHIADVARRAAVAGYVVIAPDALYPLGGYPGTDDEGREMQSQRDRGEMLEDFIAAADVIGNDPDCNGNVGCVGFCFGGAITNMMAVRIPTLKVSVPFYGGWPNAEDAASVSCPLYIHLAALDERVNAGWPEYEKALIAANKTYTLYMYEGTQHGFHNDTTGRYDEAAAKLAWQRTLDAFERHLG